jgi:hypothetical protein
MARPTPYIARQRGDLIQAEEWNEIQIQAREDIQSHNHTGGEKGVQIASDGIAAVSITSAHIAAAAINTEHLQNNAVTAAKIAPAAITNVHVAPTAAIAESKIVFETAGHNHDGISGKKISYRNLDQLPSTFPPATHQHRGEELTIGNLHIGGNLQVGQSGSFTGHLGIGTTEPKAPLEVNSGDANTAAVVGLSTPNAADFIAISGGRADHPHPHIVWRRGALRLGVAGNFGGQDFSEKLRITEDGHVGIGVPAPAETLEVAGTVKATEFVKHDGTPIGGKWLDTTDGIYCDTGKVGIGTTAPREALEVHGNIRLGQGGSLYALAALHNVRVIVGKVHDDGSKAWGDGFQSRRTNIGQYRIDFDEHFAGVPVVIAGCTDTNPNQKETVGCHGISASGFDVYIWRNVGNRWGDDPFDFIVLGLK